MGHNRIGARAAGPLALVLPDPAGAVVAMESPSIYQSMYSNIFNRNKTMSPSLDAPNAKTKKARNVFYVILR